MKGDTTQMHLSTEMTIVIKLEMFIVPCVGPKTVFRNFSLQNSPKSVEEAQEREEPRREHEEKETGIGQGFVHQILCIVARDEYFPWWRVTGGVKKDVVV